MSYLLVNVLRGWKDAEMPVNGWLFGNLDIGQTYHSDTMWQRHLNRVAAKIGLPKLGSHAFRHTYRAETCRACAAKEVQQKTDAPRVHRDDHEARSKLDAQVTRPANA